MADSKRRSKIVKLKVWSDNACFTRPEMKVERVSYDVMTPSAARGVLEAIHWKPAICWRIVQIDVLHPIRWESVRRNEVGNVMSPRTEGIFIEDDRQQRAGLFLREVAYIIHAFFELTDKAGTEDTVTKHEEMFMRRAGKGQCFHRPYLGCREFAAEFSLVPTDQPLPIPIPESRDLGWMLFDMNFGKTEATPRFFRCTLNNGSISVPAWDSPEVKG